MLNLAKIKSVVSLKVGAIGTGFNTPPSIRSTPLYLNGVKNNGNEIDALIASKRLPGFYEYIELASLLHLEHSTA